MVGLAQYEKSEKIFKKTIAKICIIVYNMKCCDRYALKRKVAQTGDGKVGTFVEHVRF